MSKKIHVLKEFRFCTPATDGRLPLEKVFKPGEHVIEDEMANHPWVKVHFADGCIESPSQTKERARIAREKAIEVAADAAVAQANADAAMERIERAQPALVKSADLATLDLNTPVGQLRARQGEGFSAVPERKRR